MTTGQTTLSFGSIAVRPRLIPNPRLSRQSGFSLIELMIAISIIVVLISLLLPMVSKMRETGQRVVCANNLRQLSAAVRTYAIDNSDRLPNGARNGPPGDSYEHLPWISDATHAILISRLQVQTLSCPNIASSSILGQMNGDLIYCYQREPIGWVMGYNYLGGHTSAKWPIPWTSPQKISDDPGLPLFCDFTFESSVWTWAPHGLHGLTYGPSYTDPTKFGNEGVNVAWLDGSVTWRFSAQTHTYSATPANDYWAAW